MTKERDEAALINEPLERLALLAWNDAHKLCDPAHGCQDYHRSWSLVRWAELDGKLPAGQPFFKQWLTKIDARGGKRVLISGGADSGLTAMALDIYRELSVVPDLTFVDQCKTPVLQNKVLADHHSLKISTHRGNILEFSAEPFDAILAHSFLFFFSEEDRSALFRHWFSLLAPGGCVLLSNVVHQQADTLPAYKDPMQVKERVTGTVTRLRSLGLSVDACNEAAEVLARFWLTPVAKPPFPTQTGIERMAKDAGFELIYSIAQSSELENGGPLRHQRATGSASNQRLELVARRPN